MPRLSDPINQMMPGVAANAMQYQLVYPEIFYRVQPYIIMVCDQMDVYDPSMPTQEMMEQMSDMICDDLCKMYPDMAKYARNDETMTEVKPAVVFRRRPRRRGILGDLIDILLLSELFGRRRRRRF